ncbi:hypothetical protein CYMTET_41647 [Cymbomonas tetramitiformis]|uniref:Reverse transcriptase Ty1/copia-type domain-containing protein n=1 Tax=Cymbomonas tetramitiformis TaxID=36881 RepID=A0AAE0C5N1_9CHLO|nr:hypothetical protein CYMTET_41647 [Cymbomonas tetramitiformis]
MGYHQRMQRSEVEPCMYFIRDTELTVIILAYVDNYIIATNTKEWYDTFVLAFHPKYACKGLGILDLVMGIGVRWGHSAAYPSQTGYITQMIDACRLRDAKPATMPMASALSPPDGKHSSLPYRALLGQLQWIARCTRPNIMATVSMLSRFRTTYRAEHFAALEQIVRYLKGSLDCELVLRTASVPGGSGQSSRTDTLPICIYTDADYAGCKVTRRSTSGIATFLCGSVVIFSSTMQRCVSLSATEAEIIAMSEGAREVKYILNVPASLVNIHRPVPIYRDNQQAIHLASDYVNNNSDVAWGVWLGVDTWVKEMCSGLTGLTFFLSDSGFDDLRSLHITHIELEAVYKTVQAFLRELEDRVVHLYCDNQAVEAMLSIGACRTFATSNCTRYIHSEADVWVDKLSHQMFWEDDDAYYPGVVQHYTKESKAVVVYDDGDEETLNLAQETF